MLSRKVFGIPLLAILIPVVLLIGIVTVSVLVNSGGDILTFIFNAEERIDGEVIECSESAGCAFLQPLIFSVIFALIIVTGFAYTTLLERKLVAWFQHRVGPDRVGPWGLLQPAADGLKLIFKEDIMPAQADRVVYYIAPMLKVIPTLIVLAVVPFGPPVMIPWFDGNWYRIPIGLADLNVGILWLLGVTTIATYGVALAGWSSSNKYAMLGAMRASAQMVSYELSLGLAAAVPVMIVGSMSVGDIINGQGGLFINWFVFQNPLAAGILMIALVAETNRAPFDLPEAEQELTAGYMTEYSGMKFALFMMAEYLGMIGVSVIAASLYFGGYNDGFGLVESIPALGPLVMLGKVFLFLCGFVWLRATLPRIRYDRLMTFGWKVLLPLSLLAVVWTAVALVVGDEFGAFGYVIASAVMATVTVVAGALILGVPLRLDQAGDDEDSDYDNDPVITGERNGLGAALLTLMGVLIAIPFALYDFTLKALDSLAKLGAEPVKEQSEDTAITPTQSGD